MRLRLGGALAGAICLLASAAAAAEVEVEVSGTIVAESDRDFSQPHDLVLSPDGDFLYVADVGNDRIKVLDPTTLATLGTFAAGQLSGPHDVAFDRRGRLLVADTHNHRIAIYEVDGASGVFVGTIGDPLRKPEGVDVAADGTIYVTSASRHTVTKIRDGAVVGEVGGSGGDDNRYSRPHDIEVAPDGRVVVADPGNDRLQILDADLGFLRTVGGPAYGFNESKYFTIDTRGWITTVSSISPTNTTTVSSFSTGITASGVSWEGGGPRAGPARSITRRARKSKGSGFGSRIPATTGSCCTDSVWSRNMFISMCCTIYIRR